MTSQWASLTLMQTKILTPKGIVNSTNGNNTINTSCVFIMYMLGTILSSLQGLTHFTLKTTLGNGFHYYPHFPDTETEAQRGGKHAQVPRAANDGAGIQIQPVWHQESTGLSTT